MLFVATLWPKMVQLHFHCTMHLWPVVIFLAYCRLYPYNYCLNLKNISYKNLSMHKTSALNCDKTLFLNILQFKNSICYVMYGI